jgi:RNA polymerase sigma factor (sigma-70 family)
MQQSIDEDFRDLMQKIQQGSEDAAWELVARYGEALRRAVRRALNAKLRPMFDSTDFVQLVWLSFFRIPANSGRFHSPAALAAYLVRMAQNKVVSETRRRLGSIKYNVNAERSLDDLKWRRDLVGPSATPVAIAIAREQVSRLLAKQPKHYRQIIELKLQGHSCREIADRLQLAESTVRRFLNTLLSRIVT